MIANESGRPVLTLTFLTKFQKRICEPRLRLAHGPKFRFNVSMEARLTILLFLINLWLGTTLSHAAATDLPPWRIGVRTQFVSDQIEFKPAKPLDQSNSLLYRPAQSTYLGVALGYQWLAGTLWFSAKSDQATRAVEGESQYSDTGIALYFDRIGFELDYNRYQGFLIDNSSSRLSTTTLNGAKYYKLPDMKTEGLGAKIIFAQHPEHFSMAAAFEQSKIQNTSGGTWAVIGALRYQKVSNSGAIIPSEMQTFYGSDALINNATMANGSLGLGYGYLWAPAEGFFISPFLGLGLGYQATWWSTPSTHTSHASVTVNTHLKLGAGFNGKKFFFTVDEQLDRFQQNTSSIEIGNSQLATTLSIGLRF